MFKLYNTQSDLASNLASFFKKVFPSISKPHLKIIPDIIIGMIKSESVVTTDIIKHLKFPFSDVLQSSIERKFQRFFNNTKFSPFAFWESLISHVISNYNFKNKNVYVSFDHMYCRQSFTVFLFSLRIGNQRYPSMVPLF